VVSAWARQDEALQRFIDADEAELTAARAACEATRWSEHHRDDCAWCAHLVATNRDIAAGNARQDAYFRALTERGIDPYEAATS
jgi:hypothetical protein